VEAGGVHVVECGAGEVEGMVVVVLAVIGHGGQSTMRRHQWAWRLVAAKAALYR
jgi:hypothetical protein